jgi:hypothetical protein
MLTDDERARADILAMLAAVEANPLHPDRPGMTRELFDFLRAGVVSCHVVEQADRDGVLVWEPRLCDVVNGQGAAVRLLVIGGADWSIRVHGRPDPGITSKLD